MQLQSELANRRAGGTSGLYINLLKSCCAPTCQAGWPGKPGARPGAPGVMRQFSRSFNHAVTGHKAGLMFGFCTGWGVQRI